MASTLGWIARNRRGRTVVMRYLTVRRHPHRSAPRSRRSGTTSDVTLRREAGQWPFDADTYPAMVRSEIPRYEDLRKTDRSIAARSLRRTGRAHPRPPEALHRLH